jgi:regulator of sigma E protease
VLLPTCAVVDLLYFVLLVSSLIFIHESGHFAFAKIFGVKVLTFSIGFGPSVLRVRGKETEYRLALIPFGGFVKMLEESKQAEPILPEERGRTFESQALWKRVVIVLAGPAMNLLFPIALYTSVFLDQDKLLPPTVGVVIPGKPADGKLKPGDRIAKVGGEDVASFADLSRIIGRNSGNSLVVEVERDGKVVDLNVMPADEAEVGELDIVEHAGKVGIAPYFPAAVIGVPQPDSPAGHAKLQTFDRIIGVGGRRIDRFLDLVDALATNRGDEVILSYLRPVRVPKALGGLCDMAVLTPGVAQLAPRPRDAGHAQTEDSDGRTADLLDRTGIESADMYVAFVPEASGEWRAGLRPGDRVTALDGAPQRLWQSMEDELVASADKLHELQWMRGGMPMRGFFQLRKEQWYDEFGQHYARYVFHSDDWVPRAPDRLVSNPHRVVYAVRRGFEETASVIRFIGIGILRLAQGRLSLSSVSGPITMYDIAGQAGARGATYFVWAMALLSVNLGMINLLPIPVLDGGHLLFFLFEAARRRPLPLRVREVASLAGMVVLVLLMMVAFKNDVERRWDVIVAQVHELLA